MAGGFLWYTDENDCLQRAIDDECTASTLAVNAAGSASPAAQRPASSTFLSINGPGPAKWRTKFYNEALFGQATWNITDKFARHRRPALHLRPRAPMTLERGFNVAPPAGFAVPGISAIPSPSSGSTRTTTDISAKAGLQYELHPDG